MKKRAVILIMTLLLIVLCAGMTVGAAESDPPPEANDWTLDQIYEMAAVDGQIPSMLPSSYIQQKMGGTKAAGVPGAYGLFRAERVTPLEEPFLLIPKTSYSLYWKNGKNWQRWGGDWWTQKLPYFKLSNGQIGYCIEPFNDNAATGSPRVPMSWNDIECKWSQYGGSFEYEKQEGIALALAYGAPNNGKTSDNAKFATAAVVWDMATGTRKASGSLRFGTISPFEKTLRDHNQAVYQEYMEIIHALEKHGMVPSFSEKFASNAASKTHTLTYNPSSGKYEATLTDTNGVLEHFNYQSSLSGLTFSKKGNVLKISATPDAAAQLGRGLTFSNRGHEVAVGPDVCAVWASAAGLDTQIMVSLDNNMDPTPSYFMLKAEVYGNVRIVKTTNTGNDLGGWKISLYRDPGCADLVGTYTTDENGTVTAENLMPGTYYAREVDESASHPYWVYDKRTVKVTVPAGGTGTAEFHNDQMGRIRFLKQTNTDRNLAGWTFHLYRDPDCTQKVGSYTTLSDGTVSTGNLWPGTYYAKEEAGSDPYWVCDSQVKTIQVSPGKITSDESTTFTNIHYGRIQFRKHTNTGQNLGGWQIRLYEDAECRKPLDLYTTGPDGTVTTGNLLPGTYYAREMEISDGFWKTDSELKTIQVEAGKTVSGPAAVFTNIHYGSIRFCKTTNTGENVSGWKIGLFRDPDCTDLAGTYITDESGYAVTGNLLPGTYYAKEYPVSDPYWECDSGVRKIVVRPGEMAAGFDETVFHNLHYGKLKIIKKTTDPDGPLAGWKFRVMDADGMELAGSPFTTDANGEIAVLVFKGTYTVEEILPPESLYSCDSENPQKVFVLTGETAAVTFTNTLRPGMIGVVKTDPGGNRLAGASFCLEWSRDGRQWEPVHRTESPYVEIGGSDMDGCITTRPNGFAVWGKLHPGLLYRITEVKAPNGYQLLKDTAWTGKLPQSDLMVTVKVINRPVVELPHTGSHAMLAIPAALMLCGALILTAIDLYRKDKK